MINNPVIYKFFKDFTNHRKNRAVVFSCRPFPNILQYRDHWWNLLTIWKTRLLIRHLLRISANIKESSSSQFFLLLRVPFTAQSAQFVLIKFQLTLLQYYCSYIYYDIISCFLIPGSHLQGSNLPVVFNFWVEKQ